jgi:hypothetical protein
VIKHTLLALVFGLALCVTASAQPTPPVVIPTLNSHTAADPEERRGRPVACWSLSPFRLLADGPAVRFHFLYGPPAASQPYFMPITTVTTVDNPTREQ